MPPIATLPLIIKLSSFLRTSAIVRPGDRVVVAFSGGPDSTALLWGLKHLEPELGFSLHAAHFDHGLDPDSARRARAASEIARHLGVDFSVGHGTPGERNRGSSGLEADARAARYTFLERAATSLGARWIATAHHADDQAETVLLRLLFGSGLHGLAGIQAVRGRLVRPLLELERKVLLDALASARGLLPEPVEDPTNLDLTRPRNFIRHRLLPALELADPDLRPRLCRLATVSRAASKRVESWLGTRLDLRQEAEGNVAADRRAFEELPKELFALALGLMHRSAGVAFPPPATAGEELARQLRAGHRVGCDSADGWRWEADAARVRLEHRPAGAGILTGLFTYTLPVPGELELSELRLRFRLQPAEVADWMFRGRSSQAGLAADLGSHSRVVVRNRRPGDRVQPLGGHRRRLKDLLIEHRVPRQERDRLPLLVIDDEIAWVPGITIGERFRLAPGATRVWVAELEPFRA